MILCNVIIFQDRLHPGGQHQAEDSRRPLQTGPDGSLSSKNFGKIIYQFFLF